MSKGSNACVPARHVAVWGADEIITETSGNRRDRFLQSENTRIINHTLVWHIYRTVKGYKCPPYNVSHMYKREPLWRLHLCTSTWFSAGLLWLRSQMRRNYAAETLYGHGYLATNYMWAWKAKDGQFIYLFFLSFSEIMLSAQLQRGSRAASCGFLFTVLSEDRPCDAFVHGGRLHRGPVQIKSMALFSNSQVDLWGDFRNLLQSAHALSISHESDVSNVPFLLIYSCRCSGSVSLMSWNKVDVNDWNI